MTEAQYYEAADLWCPERFEGRDEQERFARAAALLPADAASLADIGCGQGAFLRYLEEHRPGMRLHGLERSGAAVARRVCETAITIGSIDALPYADREIDVVAVLEVLEHLPFGVYEAGLRELERTAGRGILITVPYAEKRRTVRCPYCGCRFQPNYHMRSFEPSGLDTLFDGFRLVTSEVIHGQDYLGGPLLRWGYRWLHGGVDDMPPASLCPQCGYRREPVRTMRKRVAGRLRHRLPNRMRPRWLLASFERA